MFLTSQHSHWDKDCNYYMLVSNSVEHKLHLCYEVPTAQEPGVLAIPGMSLQMACGLQGGHVNIVSLQQKQKHDRDAAFDTQECQIQSAEDHGASIWLWERQPTL